MEGNGILVLLVCLIALLILYGLAGISAIVRLCQGEKEKLTFAFYTIVLIALLVKIGSFCYILIAGLENQIELDKNVVYVTLVEGEDALFLVSFLMLFWVLCVLFFFGHVNNLARKFFFTARLVLLIMMVVFTLLITFLSAYLDSDWFYFWIALLNIVIPVLFLLCECILYIKFSGKPYKSDSYASKISSLNKVIAIWSFGRIIKGLFSFYQSFSHVSFISSLISSKDDVPIHLLTVASAFFGEVIITELLPFYFVLDSNFRNVLNVKPPRDTEGRPKQNSLVVQRDLLLDTGGTPAIRQPLFSGSELILPSDAASALLTTFSEVTLKDHPVHSRKRGFGKVYSGTFRGQTVDVRLLEFPRLSSYLVEDTLTEASRMRTLMAVFKKIPLPVAIAHNENRIGIITEPAEGTCLAKFLHKRERSGTLSLPAKSILIKNFAQALAALHSQGLSHGHLTPHNIFVKDDLSTQILDVGYTSLKKYAAVMSRYTNKSQYTSPELLSEEGDAIVDSRRVSLEKNDVYSFGIIVWEILTEAVPFKNLHFREFLNAVVTEDMRPKITDEVPQQYVSLIRVCWQSDPSQRPDMPMILRLLGTEPVSYTHLTLPTIYSV
eukprot:TRINITY_DN2749_c0_g3_i2.p1 TRINITY_DN2749_c0_g3~~TRINITY_DN2749_c0_g3_i2.p1  ORF type:complete len:608 (-),score=62.39 TRINITY_DN2749_c0_g3_i2:38-1861(-)